MQNESKYTLKPYDELFFTDDFLFTKIMRDPQIAKGVVQNLLGIKVKKIEFITSQYSIDELYGGKGIRLDAYLEDEDKVIDIEMQTVIKKDEGLRMRYYQSMMDIDHLNRGEGYSDLKESYVVFICLDDPLGGGKPVYNFVTKEADGGLILNDRIHKVIYNASSFEKAENPQSTHARITRNGGQNICCGKTRYANGKTRPGKPGLPKGAKKDLRKVHGIKPLRLQEIF